MTGVHRGVLLLSRDDVVQQVGRGITPPRSALEPFVRQLHPSLVWRGARWDDDRHCTLVYLEHPALPEVDDCTPAPRYRLDELLKAIRG